MCLCVQRAHTWITLPPFLPFFPPPSLPSSLSFPLPPSLPPSLSPSLPPFLPPSLLSQGESVIQVEANDQDFGLNESVTYSIVSGNAPLGGEPSFDINSTTGVIFVNVTSLDRERTAVYTLTVMVHGCETLSPFLHLLFSPSPLFLPLRSPLPPPPPSLPHPLTPSLPPPSSPSLTPSPPHPLPPSSLLPHPHTGH